MPTVSTLTPVILGLKNSLQICFNSFHKVLKCEIDTLPSKGTSSLSFVIYKDQMRDNYSTILDMCNGIKTTSSLHNVMPNPGNEQNTNQDTFNYNQDNQVNIRSCCGSYNVTFTLITVTIIKMGETVLR